VLNVFYVHALAPLSASRTDTLLYFVSIWRLPNTRGKCPVAAEHPVYASAVTKFCVNRLPNFVAGPVGRHAYFVTTFYCYRM
jgi:hypothetical protein